MTPVHLLNTKLVDRILYSDGDSTIPCDQLLSLAISGVPVAGKYVDTISDKIIQFNLLVPTTEQIQIKRDIRKNNMSWTIPSEFKDLLIEPYVTEVFTKHEQQAGYSPPREHKMVRLANELILYKKMKLYPVLRVLIYIIHTLRNKNIVWGVGRGSSVSSYLLYIIGVHDVDSEEYNLDISEFLRYNGD